jgi:hypothetical protein
MPGIPGAPPGPIAARISSSLAPHDEQDVAVGGFFAPHFGQVMSIETAAGLKHMRFLLSTHSDEGLLANDCPNGVAA